MAETNTAEMQMQTKGLALSQLDIVARRIRQQAEAAAAAAVAASAHLTRKKVDSVADIDLTAPDADLYIYMVPRADAEEGNRYDEYMVFDGKVEKVGDWGIDLSGYQQKEDGKGLSANDYTDEDKAKLAGIAGGATRVEAGETPGCIRINGAETHVIEFATDEEVNAILDAAFGAEGTDNA